MIQIFYRGKELNAQNQPRETITYTFIGAKDHIKLYWSIADLTLDGSDPLRHGGEILKPNEFMKNLTSLYNFVQEKSIKEGGTVEIKF